MTISAANVKYVQHPSHGQLVLFNKTDKELSFLPQTKFVTNDGRLFASTKGFSIPAGTEANPGTSAVDIKALEYDEANVLMGSRGNIPKGTNVFIRNMKTSFYMQHVYGQAVSDFSGGSVQSNGIVTQQDIDTLSGKLVEYITSQKKNIVMSTFKDPKSIVLSFNDLLSLQVKNIIIKDVPGERSSTLKGTIIVRIKFFSVQRAQIIDLVNTYLKQRSTENIKSLRVDENSLAFFKNLTTETGVLVIPTKVSVFQTYDFTRDINGILSDIKARIAGLTTDKARDIVVSYPEIAGVKITIRPPWYTTISKLKSRIKIYVDGKLIRKEE